MFLETQSLDVSFRIKHGDRFYMVYASAGLMKCFECGDVGHKRVLCPHRQIAVGATAPTASATPGAGAPPAVGGVVAAVAAPVSDHGAGDKPVAASDAHGVPGSQLHFVGDREDAGAAGGEVMEAEPAHSGKDLLSEDEEDEEESDTGLTGAEKGQNSDIYTLEEINDFLDDTFGKSVKVQDYFQDNNTSLRTAVVLQKRVGFEALNEKKRYRLKKHVTALKKASLKKRSSKK